MKKEELIERLSGITEVTSRNGLHYTIRVPSEQTNIIMFKRSANHEEDSLPINELLCLINSSEQKTTTVARKYISGRKQSPAIAIIDELNKHL